jgi:hypothetical protein
VIADLRVRLTAEVGLVILASPAAASRSTQVAPSHGSKSENANSGH